MRVPFVAGSDLHVPTEFLRNPAKLKLKAVEIVLVLHVCNMARSPGELPAPTLTQLGRLMNLSKARISFWKTSLERKGYLLSKPKIAEDGRTEAAYWDLSPLWQAVENLSDS